MPLQSSHSPTGSEPVAACPEAQVAQVESSAEIGSARAPGVPAAAATQHENVQQEAAFVSFVFHEGSSTAVRKPIRINELI